MKIVAVGASGNAGQMIVRMLAPSLSADDELVLAGRRRERLATVQSQLNTTATVGIASVDVEVADQVSAAVEGADLVIVTVSRPDLVATLAEIVLQAGADWFDTLLSTPVKHSALGALAPQITAAGQCFVTDGGFHPGLPGVMVRWAGERLDTITSADVMAGMQIDWQTDTLSDSTISEMLDEFTDFSMATWIDGQRRELRWTECPVVDFGEPIGRKSVVPMALAEMDALPTRYPSLQRCGFYVSGFSPAFDYLAMPVLMAMSRFPRLRPAAISFARWSMARLCRTKPPYQLSVQLEAIGERAGRPATASVRISGEDSYLLTAAPAVACLRGVLDGSIRTPGVHLQADLVSPTPLLAELAAAGLTVETALTPTDAAALGPLGV